MKLIIRFTIHFVLHQVLLLTALSLAPIFYIVVLKSPPQTAYQHFVVIMTCAIYIGYCLLYGFYVARPLYQMIDYIQRLANDESVTKPEMDSGRKQTMRYPRMYREIFTNLQKLEWNLQETERKRADLERLRKEWTAGITHDLKTPLSVISGYANMLLSPDHTWEDGERDEFVRIIREKANHMEELIADLNIAFKLDTAPDIPLNPERIDLVELLRRTVADAMNIPSQPTDTWEFHAPEKAVYIMADVKLLQRALLNVLTNAVLHNPSGTKIEVFLQTKLEHAEIKIRDNGAGMDEWTVLHLFDRYYRGTSTELPTIGTGLGMAIAKQLITSHGGTIHVRSSVGEGTSVLIRLPVLLEL